MDAPGLNSRAESHSNSSPSSTQEIVSEGSHVEELRKRKLIEEELESVKNDRDRLREELQVVMAQNFARSLAIWTMGEFKNCDFDSSLRLSGSDESWSIHKGFLSHSQVTVRIWHRKGLPDTREFYQEVEILSKVRHPNLISLIGVCREAWALVYEYLPSGSLEQRLSHPPLLWKARMKIVIGLCSGLIFLHSRKPLRVVHGALKPSSIFLDSNLNCKIGNFGLSYLMSHDNNSPYFAPSSSSPATLYTDPRVVDGEGEITPLSDVYSFGMILLELLTGKIESGMANQLKVSMDNNTLNSLLDKSAGQWPSEQAVRLARLGVWCCNENPTQRPHLEAVWNVLQPIRDSCQGSISHHHHKLPSCFSCPITRDVMNDPYIAADGYSYELTAITEWIVQWIMTNPPADATPSSPMTNIPLTSAILYPNTPLRSAIKEWPNQP